MSETQPKKDSLTSYRLDMIEKRMESQEKQNALILEKLEALRHEHAKSINGPSMLLRSQIDHIAVTLEKIDGRLDVQNEEINKLKAWRAWSIGLALPIVAFLSILADDIKAAIFTK
jgi:septal ring factor EnvC (AmiA/AmiB activator)